MLRVPKELFRKNGHVTRGKLSVQHVPAVCPRNMSSSVCRPLDVLITISSTVTTDGHYIMMLCKLLSNSQLHWSIAVHKVTTTFASFPSLSPPKGFDLTPSGGFFHGWSQSSDGQIINDFLDFLQVIFEAIKLLSERVIFKIQQSEAGI